MLLSHTYNNINNSQVMDDIADQDWFNIEPEEINKQPADQSPPHFEFPYLNLDVPLDDENGFYMGQHQFSQNLEPRPSNAFEAQNDGGGANSLENGGHLPDMQISSSREIRPNESIHQYLDCPPTTSLVELKPCVPQRPTIHNQQQEHPTTWMSQQPSQELHQYYQQLDHQSIANGQFMPVTLPNDSRSIYHNGGQFQTHPPIVNNNTSMLQLDPPAPLQNHQFYAGQPYHHLIDQQSIGVESGPPNFVLAPEQILQPNHSQPYLMELDGNAKTVVPKKSKTNSQKQICGGANCQQNNKQPNEKPQSSGLDQIAKSLFTNQRTATLEFNDPQLAVEFATLMGRCQQLMEQKAAGMDVNAELKLVEASIAEYIMRNTTTPENSSTQQQPTNSGQISTGQQNNNKPSQPKRNRPKKKPAPKPTQQNSSPSNCAQLPPTTTILEAPPCLPQMLPPQNADFLPTHQDQAHPPIVEAATHIHQLANGQPQINAEGQPLISVTANNGRNATPIHVSHSIAPSNNTGHSSSNKPTSPHHFLLHQNSKVAQQKEQTLPVFVPVNTPVNKKSLSAKQLIYSKRQIRVVAQENAEEVLARLAQQKEKRRERLANQFGKMREQIQNQDYKTPFKGKMDCIQRLLPFALYDEPDFNEDFLQKYDTELERHSKMMRERQKLLEQRFRSIIYREAMGEMDEGRNLLLFLDGKFERERLSKEIAEKAPAFVDRLASTMRSPKLDWEYNGDWDHEHFRNIQPLSPSPEPKEEYSSESDQERQKGEKIVEEQRRKMNEESPDELLKETVIRLASVQVHLQAHHVQKEVKVNEAITSEITLPKVELGKSPGHSEMAKPNPEPFGEILSVQQFTMQKEAQELAMANSPVVTKAEPEYNRGPKIMPIMEKDIAVMRSEDVDRTEEDSQSLEPMNGSQGPIITLSPQQDQEKKSQPVRLTIKFQSKKEDKMTEEEEKKLRKEMKRIRKAEKKAKKWEKKIKREREKEGEYARSDPGPSNSNGGENNSIGKSPLKISFRRPIPPGDHQMEKQGSNKIEKATLEEPTGTGCFGGMLKLRISKLVLGGKEDAQNGTKVEEEEKKKREKRKKREHKEIVRKNEDVVVEEEEPPKKVPKIKIRFGNDPFGGPKPPPVKEAAEVERVDSGRGSRQMPQANSAIGPSPTSSLVSTPPRIQPPSLPPIHKQPVKEEPPPPKVDDRIRFSPCSSDDDSDSDLRQRTNQLLSKIGRLF